MTITETRVRKLISEGKLKGIVSITIDNVLGDTRYKNRSGRGTSLCRNAQSTDDNGMFRDIVHPINGDIRKRNGRSDTFCI